jgi:hypothetical protein
LAGLDEKHKLELKVFKSAIEQEALTVDKYRSKVKIKQSIERAMRANKTPSYRNLQYPANRRVIETRYGSILHELVK